MLQPKKTKYRKAFKGRIKGNARGGTDLNFGFLWPQGYGTRAYHGSADRSGSPRDHPSHQASGTFVDPDLPGRACNRRSLPKFVRVKVKAPSNSGQPA